MSNASTTTITVNTGVFTAGDTLIITNIGAGVCTITAGTATVSTAGSLALAQYDSGTLYFSSTSAAIWNGANPGDITGVTAGTGISGGGTSGTITVTNDMATTITTAGDLIYGTGSGTYTRRGIGSTGNVLTVSGGVPVWSAPAGGGKVLQVVQGTTTTTTALSSTTYTDTTLTASITPTASTSKVLCLVMLSLSVTATVDGNGHGALLKLVRASTDIVTNGRALLLSGSTANDTLIQGLTPITYLGSPATTSATTYKVQFACDAASTTIYAQIAGVPSTIVLLEIGA
jgi:hypothetical protein